MRRSRDRIIFILGFPILVNRHLYIELMPRLSATTWIISWNLPITFTERMPVKVTVCWTYKKNMEEYFHFSRHFHSCPESFHSTSKKTLWQLWSCVFEINFNWPLCRQLSQQTYGACSATDQLGNGMKIRCFESPILHEMPIHQRYLFGTSK